MPDKCKWIYDEYHDYWHTECGEGQIFTAGGPKENKYKYCPYCGKEIEVINCEYYVPAWEGSKTSGPQPDFCLKHRVVLYGKCIKSCKEQSKQSEVEESEVRNRN